MTRITINTRSETGLFFLRHAGVSTGFKTLQDAYAAAEALKAQLGGNATIRET